MTNIHLIVEHSGKVRDKQHKQKMLHQPTGEKLQHKDKEALE